MQRLMPSLEIARSCGEWLLSRASKNFDTKKMCAMRADHYARYISTKMVRSERHGGLPPPFYQPCFFLRQLRSISHKSLQELLRGAPAPTLAAATAARLPRLCPLAAARR